MTSRVQLAVRVPVEDIERYESYLRETYVQKHPYAGIEFERELRTLREDNDLAALADGIDRVLRAAGRRPTDDREKNILTRSVSDGPTKPVNYRIDPDVREWFVHAYDEPGRVAGQLMRYIADGGTVDRLLRRFRRVADDTEALLADLAGDGPSGPKERRTRSLRRLLTKEGDGFNRDDFAAALDSADVEGIADTDHARNEYLPRVLEQLNYLPHPDNPDVFFAESKAREFGADPDAPAIDLWAPEDIERIHDEAKLVEGLQIELTRDAAAGNGRTAYTTTEVRADIFDGRLSRRKVSSLMDSAATADGFKTKSGDDGKRIVAYLRDIDGDVTEHVDPDKSGASTPASDAVDDVEEQTNRLANATAVTDGGVPDE